MGRKALTALVGGILVAVSPFIPTFTAKAKNVSQVIGYAKTIDGILVIVLGLIGVIIALFMQQQLKLELWIGIISGLIPIYDLFAKAHLMPDNMKDMADATLSPGIGFYLILLGAVILIASYFIPENNPQS